MAHNLMASKDPNGLMNIDLIKLRQVFKRDRYTPKHSEREIMYREGQQSVLDYIERMVAEKHE